MRIIAALVATALLLAGCSAVESTPAPQPGMTEADFFAQQLSWRDCQDGFECADILAPLDWSNPGFGTIELALLRDPARIDSASLVLNPGGPGVSANNWLRSLGSAAVTPAVANEYHLVSFDPRGVGDSSAVVCADSEIKDELLYQDSSGLTDAETADLISSYIADCKEGTGPLLEFVDTVSAARDLELIRALLGEEKLNFLGYSYGTELGSVYLALFPDKVGRFVFDGAIDPTLSQRDSVVNQLVGFDSAFASFLQYCEQIGCSLTTDEVSAEQKTKQLIDDLEINPIPVGSRSLTSAGLLTGIIAALYSQDSWTILAQAFDELVAGDGELMLRLADFYNQRNPDGSYASNLVDANIAISCADDRLSADPAAIESLNRELAQRSLVFGESWSDGHLICENWPGSPKPRDFSYLVDTSGEVVVIGTTNDPATPYSQAVALSELLVDATLITFRGEGHTIFGQGVSCVDNQVNEFLLQGFVPQISIC